MALKLLSQIYMLLDEYDASDFRRASRSVGHTRYLTDALMLLAQYKVYASRDSRVIAASSRRETNRATTDKDLSDALSRTFSLTKEFPTTRALATLLADIGVPVQWKPKMSRSRLLAQVERTVGQMPSSEQRRVYSRLVARVGGSDLGKWFRAIKGE